MGGELVKAAMRDKKEKWNWGVVLKGFRESGLTAAEYAKSIGMPPDTLYKKVFQLKTLPVRVDELQEFKDNRADILAGYICRMVSGLSDEKIKSAGLGELTGSISKLARAERDERGLSSGGGITVNLSISAANLDAFRVSITSVAPESAMSDSEAIDI